MTRDELFKKRMDEFAFAPIHYWGSDMDVFHYKFHIVKWVETEQMRIYSLDEKRYVEHTTYNYAIGELEWDDHEPCWEFRSIGTRFLEDGTEELMKWILDFTKNYVVVDGELVKVEVE